LSIIKLTFGSSIKIKTRWKTHQNKLSNNKHPNTHLQNTYNKYGESNFVYEILLNCAEEELLELEQYYIDYYQPEYNICKIAGSSRGRVGSEYQKQRVKELRCIKILQFDINNNFIKEWDSISQCRDFLGCKMENLYKALENPSNIYKGYYFKYKNITEPRKLKSLIKQPSMKQVIHPGCKPVYKICNNTLQVLNEYKSINDAAADNGLYASNITRILINSDTKTRNGFTWKYKEDYDKENNIQI